jgi:hypothetical protein
LRKQFKSRFSAANVSRLIEVVATDTYARTLQPLMMASRNMVEQRWFCGCSSLLTDVYPMGRENDIAGTLEDFIPHYGA